MIARDIPFLADLLIEFYQDDAVWEALERAVSASETGANEKAITWVRVAEAIKRLRAQNLPETRAGL